MTVAVMFAPEARQGRRKTLDAHVAGAAVALPVSKHKVIRSTA